MLDERGLYERLCLEGFQAGLAWITILRKREAFRRGFAGFEPERVARFGDRDVARLLADASIVRHRGKIEAVINNARARVACAARRQGRRLEKLMPGVPRRERRQAELSQAPQGEAGFRFVGPTTVYSSMEACGIVNDHRAGRWCARRGRGRALRCPELRPRISFRRAKSFENCCSAFRATSPAAKPPGTSPSATTVSRVPPFAGRFELVPDRDRHGAVDRPQREDTRRFLLARISSVVCMSRPRKWRVSSMRSPFCAGVELLTPDCPGRHVRDIGQIGEDVPPGVQFDLDRSTRRARRGQR